MKKTPRLKIISFFIILLAGLSFQACKLNPEQSFLITEKTLAPTPISPLLYSHFIEIGFGFQIAPLQAEQFFNRSFEKFIPYNWRSKNSFGFLLKEGKYITDWSGEAWYHSGYEHNSWFVAPGYSNDPATIKDKSTFLIKESHLVDISLQPVLGGCGHGEQSVYVINNEPDKWGGLAQEGKYFEEGKTYNFAICENERVLFFTGKVIAISDNFVTIIDKFDLEVGLQISKIKRWVEVRNSD